MADVPPFPEAIKAIALDANAMPKGAFSHEHLVRIAGVVEENELDAAVWLPEPVLWEWAEHLFGLLLSADAAVGSAVRAQSTAGLAPHWNPNDTRPSQVDRVLAELERCIADVDGVEILRLSSYPGIAGAALRDQVLQVGTGRRKTSGELRIKTGASDSASFRLIEAAAATADDPVIVISNDRDARTYFASSATVSVFPDWWTLHRPLLRMSPAHEVQRLRIATELAGRLETASDVDLTGATVSGGSGTFPLLFDSSLYLSVQVDLQGINLAMDYQELDISPNGNEITGEVLGSVSLTAQAAWWNDREERLEHEWVNDDNVGAVIRFSATRAASGWDITIVGVDVD
ncbi:MAG: hypothetical protein Q8R60_15575 [Mycobacteriales bacterium]|nr:hypothetical protein [Mycobacteriales bacterium]